MALPYPSMNFVPLDVLTAAQQNQLVANIEYLNTQDGNLANSITTLSNKLGGWYFVGAVQAYGQFINIDLPTPEPWGIRVYAATEALAGDVGWGCDILARDANDTVLTCLESHFDSSTVTTSSPVAANAFAHIPVWQLNVSGMVVAESVKSGDLNWRSWTYQATGGQITSWSGCARQQSGSDAYPMAKIQMGTSYSGNNYLEIWAKNNPQFDLKCDFFS